MCWARAKPANSNFASPILPFTRTWSGARPTSHERIAQSRPDVAEALILTWSPGSADYTQV